MTKLNQFESVFRSADKATFAYRALSFGQVLLVTDLSATDSEELLAEVRAFLGAIDGSGTEWSVLPGAFDNVQALLEGVEARQPDLIVT